MTYPRFFLWILVFTILSFSACIKTYNPIPKLATGGNGQFIASVNGNVYVFNTANISYANGRFSLEGMDSIPGQVQRIEIYFPAKTTGIYTLSSGTSNSGSVGVYMSAFSWKSVFSRYFTNRNNPGSITVTQLDTINKVISASFAFPATSNAILTSTPDIIQVSNGSFIHLTWQ